MIMDRIALNTWIGRAEIVRQISWGSRALLLWLLSALAVGGAEMSVESWVKRYAGPGQTDDRAAALTLDASGNVFVTGYSETEASGRDFLTIKYSPAGVPLWVNRYNGTGNDDDEAAAVAVDRNGNVFVTGSSYGGVGFGLDLGYVTIKYSNAGVLVWNDRYSNLSDGDDVAKALAVDDSGNVFVTGFSDGTDTDHDYATIKYSGNGVRLWTKRFDGPANFTDEPRAIAVDLSGNAYVTGFSEDDLSLRDYATIKYSNAGAALWTNRYDGPASFNDEATALAVAAQGNCYVTGFSEVDSEGHSVFLTVAYSSAGAFRWAQPFGSGEGFDRANAIALDPAGNVFVTGTAWNGTGSDYVTLKYSDSGAILWTNRYHGPASDDYAATAIAVDGTGQVFVTGGLAEDSAGPSAYVTIKYANAGAPLWTATGGGPAGDDIATALGVDPKGNVFVTGNSLSADPDKEGFDIGTVKYSTGQVVPIPIALRVDNHQSVLSWTNAGAFNLQSSSRVDGPFTNVPAASSPFTNAFDGTERYFRLQAR
jgi:hypothetical protein